jgi:transposase
MERYKKGNDRKQISILPICLDDMLSDNAEVRALEIIIDKMDICSLGFTHCESKQTGRMAYDPARIINDPSKQPFRSSV